MLEEALNTDLSYADVINIFVNETSSSCEATFQRDVFWNTLEEANYDLVVVPGAENALCYLTIPHRLRLPYVIFGTAPNPLPLYVPGLPSAEQAHSLLVFDDNPSFWNRLENLFWLFHIYWVTHPSPIEGINFL